jgi:hypothetical protein
MIPPSGGVPNIIGQPLRLWGMVAVNVKRIRIVDHRDFHSIGFQFLDHVVNSKDSIIIERRIIIDPAPLVAITAYSDHILSRSTL